MTGEETGCLSAVQTLGTLDGPGVRFVVFLQGCPLRCACCHNPETWDPAGGESCTARQLAAAAVRYRPYFGPKGGVTLSGGEPLLQPEFAAAFFRLCRENGLHTCLDTSGCRLDDRVAAVLDYTDYCLLDIKFTTDRQYRDYVGCGLKGPLDFLACLNERQIPTRLRQVVIRGLNDSEDSIRQLGAIARSHPCVAETELLPFRTLCAEKYDRLGIPFRLKNLPETTPAELQRLRRWL